GLEISSARRTTVLLLFSLEGVPMVTEIGVSRSSVPRRLPTPFLSIWTIMCIECIIVDESGGLSTAVTECVHNHDKYAVLRVCRNGLHANSASARLKRFSEAIRRT